MQLFEDTIKLNHHNKNKLGEVLLLVYLKS